jgi:hypothetical protein
MSFTDIGHGVKMSTLTDPVHGCVGVIVRHNFPGSRAVCSTASLFFDLPVVHERYPGQPVWKVHSPEGEPLTLWPAIYCDFCRRQGFLFEGRWEPDD